MLQYSAIQTMRHNIWLRRMWILAVLAIAGSIVTPAFAAQCCCQEMAQPGHSHSSTAFNLHEHDGHQHAAHQNTAHHEADEARRGAVSAQNSVSRVCEHTRCDVSPLKANSTPNRSSLVTPLVALAARPLTLQMSLSQTRLFCETRSAQPLAPDRFSSSGLSPPAPLRS